MKRAAYGVLLVVAVACVALTGTVIWFSITNSDLQERVQRQQDVLNRGVLSAQGREISANVLRAMGAVATTNAAMRDVLRKHGYTVDVAAATNGAGMAPVVEAVTPTNGWRPVGVLP